MQGSTLHALQLPILACAQYFTVAAPDAPASGCPHEPTCATACTFILMPFRAEIEKYKQLPPSQQSQSITLVLASLGHALVLLKEWGSACEVCDQMLSHLPPVPERGADPYNVKTMDLLTRLTDALVSADFTTFAVVERLATALGSLGWRWRCCERPTSTAAARCAANSRNQLPGSVMTVITCWGAQHPLSAQQDQQETRGPPYHYPGETLSDTNAPHSTLPPPAARPPPAPAVERGGVAGSPSISAPHPRPGAACRGSHAGAGQGGKRGSTSSSSSSSYGRCGCKVQHCCNH